MTPTNGAETMDRPPARYWLLIMEGDLEPCVIGPLDEPDVLVRARLHRASDCSAGDGLYAISLDAEGNLRVETFAYAELEPQE
ncbi:hypothetical protein [Lamprocystis purpurea]|jgi:hypothetical protein|uniref:hypothetical protein n=1 Tax=Lamprocystis purpurea TaxID=61598 RepID=UPI0003A10E12|nr:hypothetical protein [Lamprocystis purpurea]